MDTFSLVTEVAVYRRRYVVKNLPTEKEKCTGILLSTLVGSNNSVELPEGYVLLDPISSIKYSMEPLDLGNLDDVSKRCVSCLTSLDEPIKEVKKKPKFINDGTMNKDKQYRTESVETVQPKKKRATSIDWASFKEEKVE